MDPVQNNNNNHNNNLNNSSITLNIYNSNIKTILLYY